MENLVDYSGRPLRLGRLAPRVQGPRLILADYLEQTLPTPPARTSYWDMASSALSEIYLNDQEGDCVIAMMQHIDDVLMANAGVAPIIFSDTQTNLSYSAIGGYVPGDPSTDRGCDEVTALNYWQQHGLLPDGAHKIDGWATVNATHRNELAAGLWLFENLAFGMALPDEWLATPPAPDFVWDVAGEPDQNNGHAVCGVDIHPEGIVICSWGMRGLLTWAAAARYAIGINSGETYVVFGQDAINRATQKSASGFSAAALTYDLTIFKKPASHASSTIVA